jgi:hypothetical protein
MIWLALITGLWLVTLGFVLALGRAAALGDAKDARRDRRGAFPGVHTAPEEGKANLLGPLGSP